MKLEKKTKRAIGAWILVAALTGTAFAGLKSNYLVEIDDANKWAWGALGAAFNSADNTQYIGCFTFASNATCIARNSAGLTRSCTTNSADNLAVIRSLAGDALLRFEWDDNGQCKPGTVNASHFSYHRPKKPTL